MSINETAQEPEKDNDFLDALEQGIRDVLKNRKAKPSEKVAAITAGAKLLAVRHKIEGNDETGFFS